MKRRYLIASIIEVTALMLSLSVVSRGLRPNATILLRGTIVDEKQPIELGLRTDSFWDEYVKNPYEFLKLAGGRVTLVYVDSPWVKELFINFDPNDLDKPLWKGNWGYDYTFRDYLSFFRVLNQNGIKIVFAVSGIGNGSKPNLNFFLNYPSSAVDSEWVNPNYVDPTWSGKTFLEMYAEKINSFASLAGIPAIVAVEDWRYPGYMMQHPQLTEFKDALKSLNQTNDLWMPPASFCSARVTDYNAFKGNHSWVSEFSSDGMTVGGSDVILQGAWDTYQVYHSSVNVAGWIGAQMSSMPYDSGIMLKLYFGGQDLNINNPGYDLAQMKRKLENIIAAAYLTRVVTPQGEYCPVKGFILVYKPQPIATLNDMLEILQYAREMEPLRYANVQGPILRIPSNLGNVTYPDRTSPMDGYLIGKGLIPFRFIQNNNLACVGPSEKIVIQSSKDYSSDFNIAFSTSANCLWYGITNFPYPKTYVIFHDGGYEGGVYDANGTYHSADMTSYLHQTTIELNSLQISVPSDSVTFHDAGS